MKAILTAVVFSAAIGSLSSAGTQLVDSAPQGFVHLRDSEEGKKWTTDLYINVSHIISISVSDSGEGKDERFHVYIETTGIDATGSKGYRIYYANRKKADEAANRLFKAVHQEGRRPRATKAEQGGARQPATAPDSKSEGNEKPKPESKGRSQ